MTGQPCIVCGRPSSGPRCDSHTLADVASSRRLRREHDAVRALVLSEETTCWVCGKPARDGDPLTFDHLVPRARGGETTRANGRAAHRSCNGRRGAGTRGGRAIFASDTGKAARLSARTEPVFQRGVPPGGMGGSDA